MKGLYLLDCIFLVSKTVVNRLNTSQPKNQSQGTKYSGGPRHIGFREMGRGWRGCLLDCIFLVGKSVVNRQYNYRLIVWVSLSFLVRIRALTDLIISQRACLPIDRKKKVLNYSSQIQFQHFYFFTSHQSHFITI